MKNKHSFENFVAQYASEEWIFLVKNYIQVKFFKKGDNIFTEGTPVTGVYFINYGKVKITSRYNIGSERIMRLANAGGLLGHRAFYTNTFPVSATPLTDVEVTYIPKDIFIKFVKANPSFSLYLLQFISKDLHDTEERMKSMIHHEVIVRICNIIFMLIDAYGYDLKDPKKLQYVLSRSDIASFAGTTYESVIRNLGKLEELKLIKLDNKSIIVPSEEALLEFVSTSTSASTQKVH